MHKSIRTDVSANLPPADVSGGLRATRGPRVNNGRVEGLPWCKLLNSPDGYLQVELQFLSSSEP